jgi:hypothetical protein
MCTLGTRSDGVDGQSRLARSILGDHLICVVTLAAVLCIQLGFAR